MVFRPQQGKAACRKGGIDMPNAVECLPGASAPFWHGVALYSVDDNVGPEGHVCWFSGLREAKGHAGKAVWTCPVP